MKNKHLIIIMCIVTIATLLWSSCSSSKDEILQPKADLVAEVEKIEIIPDYLEKKLSIPYGRNLNEEIESIKKINFTDSEIETTQIAIELTPVRDNEATTILLDETTEEPSMILHEIQLNDGRTQLSYLTLDGMLFMQLEGIEDDFRYTYLVDEKQSNGRVAWCFGSQFHNCVDEFTDTKEFAVIAVLGYLTGSLGGVAGGVAIGCSFVAYMDCNPGTNKNPINTAFQWAKTIQNNPNILKANRGSQQLPQTLVRFSRLVK